LKRSRLLLSLTLGCGAFALCGCLGGSDSLPPEPVLRPVWGKVTVQGEPLAGAVISFVPADEQGTMTLGETDEEGLYKLTYLGSPGTAAGVYKVAISYLQGSDGIVYGLAPRSGLAKPYGMITAKERLQPEWSDMGRTTHEVTVREAGGAYDFDIPEPLLPPLSPEEPAEADSDAETPTAS
jgi:hypothetical protein